VGSPLAEDNSTHYPLLDKCLEREFAEYYLSYATSEAFQRFYKNESSLQTSYDNFWTLLAKTFAKEKGVLGYELINEPWAGNIYTNPRLLEPGVADKENLEPIYQRLHKVIRNIDTEHIIFYEKALTNLFGSTGFSGGPGGVNFNDRQAYSYHIYCGGTDSEGNPRRIIECDGIDLLFYEMTLRDVKQLGGGAFMTEFGAMGEAKTSEEAIRFLTFLADSNLQSWAYWQYKYFNDLTTSGSGEGFYDQKGELEEAKVRELSRTYAFAIAGIPRVVEFDPNTSIFRLSFTINRAITAPTEIYLNEDWYYPKGYEVVVSPLGRLSWKSPAKNFIQVTPNASVQDGAQVSVVIARKN